MSRFKPFCRWLDHATDVLAVWIVILAFVQWVVFCIHDHRLVGLENWFK